jgi:hypothetical protein
MLRDPKRTNWDSYPLGLKTGVSDGYTEPRKSDYLEAKHTIPLTCHHLY